MILSFFRSPMEIRAYRTHFPLRRPYGPACRINLLNPSGPVKNKLLELRNFSWKKGVGVDAGFFAPP